MIFLKMINFILFVAALVSIFRASSFPVGLIWIAVVVATVVFWLFIEAKQAIELEQNILIALDGKKQLYGREIADFIENDITGKRVSTGELYVALARLENRELVTSEVGDATPERGGLRRKYFRITPKGEFEIWS